MKDSKSLKIENPYDICCLLDLYGASLVSESFDTVFIAVKGFFSNNYGKEYGTYYYDSLLDKDGKKITLRIPKELKEVLIDENHYVFKGYLNRAKNIRDSSYVSFFLHVIDVDVPIKKEVLIDENKYAVLRNKFSKGNVDVENLILGNYPFITSKNLLYLLI